VINGKGTSPDLVAGSGAHQDSATVYAPACTVGDRDWVASEPGVGRRFDSASDAAGALASVLVRVHLLSRAYTGGLESDLRASVMVTVSRGGR
jgi:hypothetical protein